MAARCRFGGDLATTQAEVAKFSARDAERLPAYYARLDRLADQLKQWVLRAPPNLGGPFVVEGWRDLVAGAQLLLQMGRLPREGQRDLVDVFTKSAGDWLDHWFESEPLKAVLGWDSVVGNYASPYAAGLGLRAAASLLRRSERQARQVGPCDRRHGGDHAGDGGGSARARRRDHHRGRGAARASSSAARRSASNSTPARSSVRGPWRRTSTRSCCTSGCWTPARCRPSSAKRCSGTSAARERSG